MVLQRERFERLRLVHVTLLAEPQGRAHAVDGLALRKGPERESVVSLEGELVPLVLDRLPFDQLAVETPIDPVVDLLARQVGVLGDLVPADPLGEAHPLLNAREEIEILGVELGHVAGDVSNHTRPYSGDS